MECLGMWSVSLSSAVCCFFRSENQDSLDFWLAAVLVHAPDARLVIVGTHDTPQNMGGRSDGTEDCKM